MAIHEDVDNIRFVGAPLVWFRCRATLGWSQRSTSMLLEVIGHLRWDSLLVVDDDAPTKVKFLVFHLEQSAGLQERKAVIGMSDHVPEVSRHLVQLPSVSPIVSNSLLVGDHNRLFLFLFLSEFCSRMCQSIPQKLEWKPYLSRGVGHPHYSGTGRNTAPT